MKNAMQLKAVVKNLAKEKRISAILVLQNYMLERFLERVALSPYRSNFIIKGGFLISSMIGLDSRTTKDIDATIKGYPVNTESIQKMIETIITIPIDDNMEKCGFIKEGTVRQGKMVSVYCNYNIYGLLREDYAGLQGING